MKSKAETVGNPWITRTKRALLYLGLVYFGLVLLLALCENSLVYPVSKHPRGDWEPNFEFIEVDFKSDDGTQLVGWYLPQVGATEAVLVCHGNGENVAQSARHSGRAFQKALNANVFVFDYRGYGKSKGSPNQQGVLEDAEAAFDWLCDKTGHSPDKIILAGHSIGGGPAVHLASTVGGKALFLQRTFASLVDPAKEQLWFVPVDLIMRNRYPNGDWIRSCQVPLHQSHGNRDTLVPFASGQKLFDRSPAAIKELWVNEGKGHWDGLPLEYWKSVSRFIQRVNEAEAADRSNSIRTRETATTATPR